LGADFEAGAGEEESAAAGGDAVALYQYSGHRLKTSLAEVRAGGLN
jgi:hypothetical protein